MTKDAYLMTVILTGAGGFVGRHLANTLKAREMPFHPLSRADFDLDDEALAARLPHSEACIHLAGRAHKHRETEADAPLYHLENVVLTQRMLRIAQAAGVKHFIFLSTIGVHGTRTTDAAFSELSPLRPETPYAESKIQAEEEVIRFCTAHDMSWTILRPPLVYGDHAPGNIGMLQKLLRTKLPLPFAALKNRRSLISVDNLCDLILYCLHSGNARNQVYTPSDGIDRSTADLLRLLAARENSRASLIYCPVWLLKMGAVLTGMRKRLNPLWDDLRVDHKKSVTQLGWSPTISS